MLTAHYSKSFYISAQLLPLEQRWATYALYGFCRYADNLIDNPRSRTPVELLDEVCWFFPELTIIMRHGGDPWTELAVKLLLKWPNLYYSTSGFAPKHYPQPIIDFANTRGSDKIIYAGYFPIGLTYKRIFTDLRNVPFKSEVWPKFLSGNAKKLLKLD